MAEVQRDQHDGHRPDQGDRHRAASAQDGRDHEADDDRERQPKTDQRADPLPATEGQHGHHEQRHQGKHRPGSLEVADVVEGGLAFLLEDRQSDPLAGAEGGAGEVGGVEADLFAVGQPGLDVDAGRGGHARVGLLARHGPDLGQGGGNQPGGVLLAGRSWPVDLATGPEQDSARYHSECQHSNRHQHHPVAGTYYIHG
jgi:hypothetical protein